MNPPSMREGKPSSASLRVKVAIKCLAEHNTGPYGDMNILDGIKCIIYKETLRIVLRNSPQEAERVLNLKKF